MTTDVLWRDLYADAMIELDRTNLGAKIEAAQEAIQQAIRSNEQSHDVPLEETQAMADAMRNLQMLQRLEFGTPTRASGSSQTLAGRSLP
jgi:hypothetical protein